MRPFRELPDWRIDDLMISFLYPAAASARIWIKYDVFIIQGTVVVAGEWAKSCKLKHTALTRICYRSNPFEAIIDEELEPGDILYIPPGFRMKATRWKMR